MSKLHEVVQEIAPKLGEALTGPLQAQAMTIILKKLGVKTVEEAETKLDLPHSITQIKEAAEEFDEIRSGKSARTSFKFTPQLLLAMVYNVGYFVLLGFFIKMTFGTNLIINEWLKGMIGTLIGVLTAQLPSMNAWFFGSSASSAQKTDAMAKAAKG